MQVLLIIAIAVAIGILGGVIVPRSSEPDEQRRSLLVISIALILLLAALSLDLASFSSVLRASRRVSSVAVLRTELRKLATGNVHALACQYAQDSAQVRAVQRAQTWFHELADSLISPRDIWAWRSLRAASRLPDVSASPIAQDYVKVTLSRLDELQVSENRLAPLLRDVKSSPGPPRFLPWLLPVVIASLCFGATRVAKRLGTRAPAAELGGGGNTQAGAVNAAQAPTDQMYSAFVTLWAHDDNLMWSRVAWGITIEAAIVAGSVAKPGLPGILLILAGSLVLLGIWLMFKKDVRDQKKKMDVIDRYHAAHPVSGLDLHLLADAPQWYMSARGMLQNVIRFVALTNVLMLLYHLCYFLKTVP